MNLETSNKGQTRLTFYDYLIGTLDPLFLFPARFSRILKQKELQTSRATNLVLVSIWILLFLTALVFNDQRKANLSEWTAFRLTTCGAFTLIGLAAYAAKRSLAFQQLLVFLLAATVAIAMAWAMRLGPIRLSTIATWPAVILAAGIRSPTVAVVMFFSLFLGTKPLWGLHYQEVNVLTDIEISIAIILAGYAYRIIRLRNIVNDEQLREASARTVEIQLQMEAHLSRFISPVLVAAINRSRRQGLSLTAATDSVLQRRRQDVAVLYSDYRSFSEKSKDFQFIEEELIPSAVSIIDKAEDNLGIAKQVGDAVIVYYALPDPEESVLRCLKDAFRCTLEERSRVRAQGKLTADRFFTVSFSTGYVGNMASERHREPTVLGTPPNLAARIDALTKEPAISKRLQDSPTILMTSSAGELASSFANSWSVDFIDLAKEGLQIRSFPEETRIALLRIDEASIGTINKLLEINGIEPLMHEVEP